MLEGAIPIGICGATSTPKWLMEECKKVIDKEALPGAASVCKVVTSGLGEKIGDYAALSLAVKAHEEVTSSFSTWKICIAVSV